MQKTYCAILSIDQASSLQLDALAQYYSTVKKQLYREVAKKGGSCKAYKVAFCAKYKLTARQFNAIAIDLQGQIDATKELLKLEAQKLSKSIKSKKARLKRDEVKFKEVELGSRALKKKALNALKRRLYQTPKDLSKAERRLKEIQYRLKANVPGICFGSRKLFKSQFHLKESGYSSKQEWLKAWREARNHQFFFVGSKDETTGNQSCVLSVTELQGPPTSKTLLGLEPNSSKVFNARIRLPDAMVKEGSSKYVNVSFSLGYGQREVLYALEQGIALSYRFHKNLSNKKWYVYISTNVPSAAIKTTSKSYGVLGVDFNADHLAVTPTNHHGNLLKRQSFIVDLPLEGKSTQARENILSLALDKVVEFALDNKMPIAAEELDFSAKKSNIERKSKKHRVMLSSLMYSKYQELLASKCAKAGVELIKVNPAYTSVIGRIKYALPYGLSVHLSASGVIARRAQGCRETVPTVAFVATGPVKTELVLPVRNRTNSTFNRWHWYSVAFRKTLFKVISAQKRRDKHRFRYRQHSLA